MLWHVSATIEFLSASFRLQALFLEAPLPIFLLIFLKRIHRTSSPTASCNDGSLDSILYRAALFPRDVMISRGKERNIKMNSSLFPVRF